MALDGPMLVEANRTCHLQMKSEKGHWHWAIPLFLSVSLLSCFLFPISLLGLGFVVCGFEFGVWTSTRRPNKRYSRQGTTRGCVLVLARGHQHQAALKEFLSDENYTNLPFLLRSAGEMASVQPQTEVHD